VEHALLQDFKYIVRSYMVTRVEIDSASGFWIGDYAGINRTT
jgi:hypothetical protein